MNKNIWVILPMIVSLVLSGCVPGQALTQPGHPSTSQPGLISPTDPPKIDTPMPPTPRNPESTSSTSPTPGDQPEAAVKARDVLAQKLSVSTERVVIRQVEAVDWPDTCLGAAEKDEMCAQIVVPGFRVILDARGQVYEYHTNQDGTMIRESGKSQNADANQAVGQAVVQKAAQDLHLKAADFRVVKVESVEWPDSCLGIQVRGMMCLMVITPGYRVIAEAGGQNYEYHTDRTATRIMRFMGK